MFIDEFLNFSSVNTDSILHAAKFKGLCTFQCFSTDNGCLLTVRKVSEVAANTGLLIKNMIEFMDFDAIVLSGPMTGFGEEYIETIRKVVHGYGYATRIEVSALGGNATFIGAFEAARDEIIEKFAEERTAHVSARDSEEE